MGLSSRLRGGASDAARADVGLTDDFFTVADAGLAEAGLLVVVPPFNIMLGCGAAWSGLNEDVHLVGGA